MLPVLYTCTGEPYVTCVVYLYRWALCYLCCIPVQMSSMLPVLYTCTGEPYVTCVVYLYRWAICYLCCITVCVIDLMSPILPVLCSPSRPPGRSWQRSPMLPCCILHALPVLYNCMCYCVIDLMIHYITCVVQSQPSSRQIMTEEPYVTLLYTCMCYLCCILYAIPVLCSPSRPPGRSWQRSPVRPVDLPWLPPAA